jgi:hypothetical protein
MKNLFIPALLLLITVSGCIHVVRPPPVIVNFNVSHTEIKTGESATLSWEVEGVTSVTIDQGIGDVAASGNITVSPTSTTTYTLTATNLAGTETQSLTLTVGKLRMPTIPMPFKIDTFAIKLL